LNIIFGEKKLDSLLNFMLFHFELHKQQYPLINDSLIVRSTPICNKISRRLKGAPTGIKKKEGNFVQFWQKKKRANWEKGGCFIGPL
jgi:hypothetical protein